MAPKCFEVSRPDLERAGRTDEAGLQVDGEWCDAFGCVEVSLEEIHVRLELSEITLVGEEARISVVQNAIEGIHHDSKLGSVALGADRLDPHEIGAELRIEKCSGLLFPFVPGGVAERMRG